jgi:hypothetical protein
VLTKRASPHYPPFIELREDHINPIWHLVMVAQRIQQIVLLTLASEDFLPTPSHQRLDGPTNRASPYSPPSIELREDQINTIRHIVSVRQGIQQIVSLALAIEDFLSNTSQQRLGWANKPYIPTFFSVHRATGESDKPHLTHRDDGT